jgi:hypothetical protein
MNRLGGAMFIAALLFWMNSASAAANAQQAELNVGHMSPPDTIQMGYDAKYSGTGTISLVETEFSAPSVTLGSCSSACSQFMDSSFMGFILNTGDNTACTGFMQDGLLYYSAGWTEVYMNGFMHCTSVNMVTQIPVSTGDYILLEISHSGTLTTYTIRDLTKGTTTSTTAQSLSTWPDNLFETMTESDALSTTTGATNYFSSYFGDPSGNLVPVTTSLITDQYGGACTSSTYSLGAWLNTAYGYSEPSVTSYGNCVYQLGVNTQHQYGHCLSGGSVTTPTNVQGGPDGGYANLHAPNTGNCAWEIADMAASFTGTLSLYGYSYNNGAGAYYSNVTIWVSGSGTTWTKLYSHTWSPASAPSWVTIGSVSSIRYVNITVVDYNGHGCSYCGDSGNIYVDAGAVH